MTHLATNAPAPAGQIGAPKSTACRAAAFFRWLYEHQAGYIEVVAGAANPTDSRKIDLVMSSRRWCYYDADRPDLIGAAAAYAAELAKDYGNVYCGVRLYDKRARNENTRKECYTRPSRVIFIDDAPADPPISYSVSIRTSEHSRHAYYKCDKPVAKEDARRAMAALGGDPSGVDLTQLVRVPGTFNTKHGERWSVETESRGKGIYLLEDLRASWPEVAPARTRGELTTVQWKEAAHHLANIDALLSSPRAKAIKPDTQTGQILAGEHVPIASAKYGRMDDSCSAQAAILARGFYIRGFPDDEIAAVVLNYYRKNGVERRKGTAWCEADAERVITDAHDHKPGVKQTPTSYRKTHTAPTELVEQPAASRARADRPTKLDPLMLFNCYRQQPSLCAMRRKERAAALAISTATLTG